MLAKDQSAKRQEWGNIITKHHVIENCLSRFPFCGMYAGRAGRKALVLKSLSLELKVFSRIKFILEHL